MRCEREDIGVAELGLWLLSNESSRHRWYVDDTISKKLFVKSDWSALSAAVSELADVKRKLVNGTLVRLFISNAIYLLPSLSHIRTRHCHFEIEIHSESNECEYECERDLSSSFSRRDHLACCCACQETGCSRALASIQRGT